jgi:hypothetical protein
LLARRFPRGEALRPSAALHRWRGGVGSLAAGSDGKPKSETALLKAVWQHFLTTWTALWGRTSCCSPPPVASAAGASEPRTPCTACIWPPTIPPGTRRPGGTAELTALPSQAGTAIVLGHSRMCHTIRRRPCRPSPSSRICRGRARPPCRAGLDCPVINLNSMKHHAIQREQCTNQVAKRLPWKPGR